MHCLPECRYEFQVPQSLAQVATLSEDPATSGYGLEMAGARDLRNVVSRTLVPIECEELIAAALRRFQTNSERRSPNDLHVEALQVLCQSINLEAQLTPRSRRSIKQLLLSQIESAMHTTRGHQSTMQPPGSVSDSPQEMSDSDPVLLLGFNPLGRRRFVADWVAAGGRAPSDHEALAHQFLNLDYECLLHVPAYAEWLSSAALYEPYLRCAQELSAASSAPSPTPGNPQAARLEPVLLGDLLHHEHLAECSATFPNLRIVRMEDDLNEFLRAVGERFEQTRLVSRRQGDLDSVRRYLRWRTETASEATEAALGATHLSGWRVTNATAENASEVARTVFNEASAG